MLFYEVNYCRQHDLHRKQLVELKEASSEVVLSFKVLLVQLKRELSYSDFYEKNVLTVPLNSIVFFSICCCPELSYLNLIIRNVCEFLCVLHYMHLKIKEIIYCNIYALTLNFFNKGNSVCYLPFSQKFIFKKKLNTIRGCLLLLELSERI